MRIVQAGLGGWGRNWAKEVLPQVPKVELVGCVDSAPESLAAAREQGIVTEKDCYPGLAPALAATDADAVLVTADLRGHVPLVSEALEAGRHVLVEKPFAPSVAAATELVELAASRGCTLMVSQNYRFFPAVRAVQRLMGEGELGPLHTVAIDFRRFSAAHPERRSAHHVLDQPLLVDMSVHHFDLLRAVLGTEPTDVFYRGWNPSWSWFAGPAEGAAIITFGDVMVSYRGSWLSPAPATPWAGEWRMEFEHGEVTWTSRADRSDGVAGESVRVRREVGGPAEPLKLPIPTLADRAGSLQEFVDAVDAGREPESSGRDNLGTLALLYAAAASGAAGELIRVDSSPAAR